MIEEQLYTTVLLLAAGINVLMACALFNGNFMFRDYAVYRRSRLLTALTFLIFAVGFLLHYHLEWRTSWPDGASALSVSYFHMGAVLFGWSHISLLNPHYLTQRVFFRDITILVAGLTVYWFAAADSIPDIPSPTSWLPFFTLHSSFLIFFAHALYVSVVFYRTLHRVRQLTKRMPKSQSNASWWTDENRLQVIAFQRSIRISCHLIVLFGLGSIVVTACFPTQQWPYTVLLTLGIAVFCYIFYGLADYGSVIEAGTNVTEDINQ